MFRRILVPLDGTPFAEHAVPVAVMLARASDGELLLAHVHEPPLPMNEVQAAPGYNERVDREIEVAERDYLDDVTARVRARSGAPVTAELLRGDTARALHDRAVASGTELVVMASHGRGPLGRLFTGSVTERTVREPGVPVLVVRPTEEGIPKEARADGPSADDPTAVEARPFEHVLVTLDGSTRAESALDPALALARACAASVTLLGVRDPALAAAALADPESAGAEYLSRVAARISRDGVRAQARLVRDRNAAHGIVRGAADVGANVIAMATHGRGALARMVQGGVAAQVLRGSPLPVLLLNPG